MKTQGDDLICYKHISIDAHGKLKFFLEKHSTKEGTWVASCSKNYVSELNLVFCLLSDSQ